MEIYLIKNLKTGRYLGDEFEPNFECAYYLDYEEAKETAWTQNVMYNKKLTSLDKYVVEVKQMNCPIMYVDYDDGCHRKFFNVYDAIKYYENNKTVYEIGYQDIYGKHPLDLTKDWRWNDNRVICTKFDDSFWDSCCSDKFEEQPGKSFNAYRKNMNIKINDKLVKLDGRLATAYQIEKAIQEDATFTTDENMSLEAKIDSEYLHYDFGGSYTDKTVSFWYADGRLYAYMSLNY